MDREGSSSDDSSNQRSDRVGGQSRPAPSRGGNGGARSQGSRFNSRDERPARPGYSRDGRSGDSRGGDSRPYGRPPSRGGSSGFSRDDRQTEGQPSEAVLQYGALVRHSLENQQITAPGDSDADSTANARAKSSASEKSMGEVWVREDDRPKRSASKSFVAPPRRSSKKLDAMAKNIDSELAQAGVKRLRAVATRNMVDAVDAYEHDRYQEARNRLEAVLEIAPEFGPALELAGLSNYRLDRWEDALKFLTKNFDLFVDHSQDPVIADCLRALGRFDELEEIWRRLKDASPGADVMAEGRIVYASSLSERGDVAKAIELLESALSHDRRPRLHDFRQIYVLADMYEAAGNVQQARATFKLLMDVDPGLYDVAERLADLS